MTYCPLAPANIYPLAEYPAPALSDLSDVVLVDLFLTVHDRELLLPFKQIVLDFADVAFD
jgi:hypothetical protein